MYSTWSSPAGRLAQPDGVGEVGAGDQQDVGGVVVDSVALRAIAEMAVDGLTAEHGVGCAHVEHEHIDATAAEQLVAAVLAFEAVRIRAAPELIGATAAKQSRPRR